ncbi:MAG: PilX N-terminal domain-containing pilus assembly protein [Pseudoxanthomonas sp.]
MNANRPSGRRASQHGVSLLVALLLLLAMTLLGLAVLRNTTLEERMSGNLLDRTYQFQAAESALRQAEALIEAGSITVPDSGCSAGICATPVAGDADRWLDDSFAGWQTSDGTGNHDDAVTTQYFIEYMGDGAYGPDCATSKATPSSGDPNCSMLRYRVTARSKGDARASVILQSNYLVAQ